MPDITNLNQTQQFAQDIGQELRPGDIIGLIGDLGTGKTTLVKEIADFLGVKEPVTSPTYTLVKEYQLPESKGKLIHVDAYRLDDTAAARHLGLEDYFTDRNIVIIEWADRIIDLLPTKTIWFAIEQINNKRSIAKNDTDY